MKTTDKNMLTKPRKKINRATAYKKQKEISKDQIKTGHMSTAQVAKHCKVKKSTVRSWVQRGILKPIVWRQGGPFSFHYFDKKEVRELHLFRQAFKATSHKWIMDSVAINGKVHSRTNKYPNRKIHKKTLEKMQNANKSK